ncbi:MAG: protoporphyrinogen oxidase, partial [Verrucomicrobiota bacterium]
LAVISSPIWSLRGKLSALKEPFVKAAPSDSEQSVADFVRRRLGEELYKYAINPLIGGIYAGNPEKLSLRYAFPRLHELEQMHGGLIRGAIAKKKGAKKGDEPKVRKRIVTFKEGIDTLPRLIAAALGTQVHTRTTISSIRQKDEQWQVSWKSEASRSELFDQLILTVPAYALGKLPFGDSLAQRLSSLSTIHYPPVSVLSLGYRREQVKHPLDGFGALVPECEQRKILGVLFPNSIFEGRAPKGAVLLTVFVGGTRNSDLATEDTDALKGIVASDLKAFLGINSAPEFTHHRHWPTAIPQYNIGYGEVLKNIGQIETDHKGLSLLGNYRTGISLTDCIKATQSHSLGALD